MTSIHVCCVNHLLAMMPATESPIRLFNRVTRVLYIIVIIIIVIDIDIDITVITVIIIPYRKFTRTA